MTDKLTPSLTTEMLLQVCIYCVNSASHFLVICIESLTVGTHTHGELHKSSLVLC